MGAATTALLFPGQGSQTETMREDVAQWRPDLLEHASRVAGGDPFERVEEGTQFAQPAIYCASLAGFEALGRPQAAFHAGHSLGEFAALAAAGAIDDLAGLELVALRGRLTHQAGELAGDGTMLALLGPRAAELAGDIAAPRGLAVANDNAPQQVVLSGSRAALADAAQAAAEAGLRAMDLPVSGAFHSPAMAPAVGELMAALAEIEVRPTAVTVYSAVTAAPFDDVRALLAEAVTQPVLWRPTMLALHQRGARRFVEVGPGRILSGLVKRTLPDVERALG
jgi:malonyl CoA-acyl carrier protein transacylase